MSKEARIFVFGSNLAGAHCGGAALFARENRGAIMGKFEGLQGKSYALPTCDQEIEPLPLDRIREHVDRFLDFATISPELRFQVTAIGCGIAGYKPEQIAPMFRDAPENCDLPPEFIAVLNPTHLTRIKSAFDAAGIDYIEFCETTGATDLILVPVPEAECAESAILKFHEGKFFEHVIESES